jgi:hypothetical protein
MNINKLNTSIVIEKILSSKSRSIKNVIFNADKDRLFSTPNINEIKNLHYWYKLKTNKIHCFPNQTPEWLLKTKKHDGTSEHNLGLKVFGESEEQNQIKTLLNDLEYDNPKNDCLIVFGEKYYSHYSIIKGKLISNVYKDKTEATQEYCRDYYWNDFISNIIISEYNKKNNFALTTKEMIFHYEHLYLSLENHKLATQYQQEFCFV